MLPDSSDRDYIKVPAAAVSMSAKGKQLIYRLNSISAYKKPGKTGDIVLFIGRHAKNLADLYLQGFFIS